MTKILWKYSDEKSRKSNLFKFENFLKKKYGLSHNNNYEKLWKWTVENSAEFWKSIWEFSNVKGQLGNGLIQFSEIFYKNEFLSDSKLNFTENLLPKNDNSLAATFISENGYKENKTWSDLNVDIIKISKLLREIGIKKNDRIAAYLPNCIETVETFLASAAIGAIWSSCSPDFGTKGVVERFSQINPKVLFIVDKYFYNGKEIEVLSRSKEILENIPSIEYLIIVPYPGSDISKEKFNFKQVNVLKWKNIFDHDETNMNFELFEFNHPLAILYSSGTTDKPKCICHRTGGVLLQHIKELHLHCDINPNDKIFYFTTCGWMMWNWLVSSLALKASIVLFDGFPMYKKDDLLIEIANTENISLFGISAKYIDALKKNRITTINKFNLSNLKTICSTGSPLSKDGFNYVYQNIKKDVHLASISGGTDIVSCFVLGNLYQPVISGEIQNKGLGMDVDIFDEKGNSIKNKKGELVCKKPFPTMPLKFWNDEGDKKYKKAYFTKYTNIWHHGDYAEVKDSGGFIIYGRSDTTLNPGGVRLGTAEIYSEVEKFDEIIEALVVGQSWDNDIRIILFVVLDTKYNLTEELIMKIKRQIKKNASPRHVPYNIFPIKDIPRTKNGKIVELAVKQTIEGDQIKNLEALVNPESLNQFKNIKKLYE
ncbi:MAG: acetoacetate--CoA ligase [Pelagibacteraceae bacterium]|jgi:acetoacetyl-CoA synthetase|nr:acetoacetate--CoA ligase [Pelagibacteraceae bacterium]|tara:strand:+ start:5379 stop:7340 length:1962 start_codon:yes stop_codon:yes gene_type:complete